MLDLDVETAAILLPALKTIISEQLDALLIDAQAPEHLKMHFHPNEDE
jgi:hypothetical protein